MKHHQLVDGMRLKTSDGFRILNWDEANKRWSVTDNNGTSRVGGTPQAREQFIRESLADGFYKVVETPRRKKTLAGTNPKDALGAKKVQLNLVPPASVIYQALAMEDGERKYGPFNWRQNKVIASIYVAAALRHIYAWQDGEDDAADSGKPHLGHALACLGIIVDAKETGNLIDDRPVKGAAAALIAALIAKYEKK